MLGHREARILSWLIGVAGSLCLVITCLTPWLAGASNPGTAQAPAAGADATPRRVAVDAPPGLRDLPLGLSDADRSELVAADDPRDDTATRAVITRLAAPLGLGDVIDAAISTDQTDESTVGVYPYVYPGIDELIRPALDVDAVRAEPDRVVKLAAYLIVLASQHDIAGDGSDRSPVMPAGVAYALLDEARRTAPTCDIQTDLLFTLTLGMAPDLEDVRQEAGLAADTCDDDPTPAWIEGRFLRRLLTEQFGASLPDKRSALRTQVVAHFRAMQRDFPTSALGWVGQADALAEWADLSEATGAEPFQVRSWRREAKGLYEQARARSAYPGIATAEARVLVKLDEDHHAIDLVEAAAQAQPSAVGALSARADVLAAAGRHEAAAEAYAAVTKARAPWHWLVPTARVDETFAGRFGATEMPSLTVIDITAGGYGGAGLKDTSFVPLTRYAPDWAFCPSSKRRAQLVLAGRIDAVREDPSGEAAPWGTACDDATGAYSALGERYQLIAAVSLPSRERAAAIEAITNADYQTVDGVEAVAWEAWQDLLRSDDQLDEARKIATRWTKAQPESGHAWQRLGEIELLRGSWKAGAGALDRATGLLADAVDDDYSPFDDPEALSAQNWVTLSVLQHGYAMQEQHRDQAARRLYLQVVDREPEDEGYWTSKIRMHSEAQLGQLAFDRQRWSEAAERLRQAIEIGSGYEDKVHYGSSDPDGPYEIGQAGMLRGAQENNLALAEAKLGHRKESVKAAKAALERDAANPVFLDTVAFAFHLGGDVKKAANAYAAVIDQDTTSYVSANNLAVILAGAGETVAAKRLLKGAVSTAPDYAPAWHNLGVLETQSWQPGTFLDGQAAMGQAARLDRSLRGEHGLKVDDEVYDSGLDVGAPLRADWSYASTATAGARPITLTMIALLLVRVARLLGFDRLGSWISERVVASSAVSSRAGGWFWRRLRVRWGVAVCVIVLGWSALWVRPHLSTALFLGSLAGLVVTPLLVRSAVARRRGEQAKHFTWTPALGVAAVGGPLGLSFVPFPSLDDTVSKPSRAVRMVVPAFLGLICVSLVLGAAISAVPLSRDVAAACIVMTASVMTPVPPMDGASLSRRVPSLLVTIALAVVTVAFALRWV